MTDDFIKAGLLAAADDYERAHIANAAAALDDSPARRRQQMRAPAMLDGSLIVDGSLIAPDRTGRLERIEAEMIAAWGELHQFPGFQRIDGETLPDAIGRTLSAANLKE